MAYTPPNYNAVPFEFVTTDLYAIPAFNAVPFNFGDTVVIPTGVFHHYNLVIWEGGG